jgi:hypothetical protein
MNWQKMTGKILPVTSAKLQAGYSSKIKYKYSVLNLSHILRIGIHAN